MTVAESTELAKKVWKDLTETVPVGPNMGIALIRIALKRAYDKGYNDALDNKYVT